MAKKLNFDSTDADTLLASDFVGSHLYAGGSLLTSTLVGAKQSLDVYVANGIAVDLDGVYDGGSNTNPDNVGLIAHTRGATPADADQVERLTSAAASSDNVVAANVHGLDVNSFGMVYDGTTWDRLLGTAGAVHIHDGGNTITVDGTVAISGTVTVSDAALANTAVSNGEEEIADTETAMVPSPLANRKYLHLYNNSNETVFLGATGVTVANGFPFQPGVYADYRAGASIALLGICRTGKTAETRHLQFS